MEDYNCVFLQDLTYFATRHRIVRVDTDLLLERVDIVVTGSFHSASAVKGAAMEWGFDTGVGLGKTLNHSEGKLLPKDFLSVDDEKTYCEERMKADLGDGVSLGTGTAFGDGEFQFDASGFRISINYSF